MKRVFEGRKVFVKDVKDILERRFGLDWNEINYYEIEFFEMEDKDIDEFIDKVYMERRIRYTYWVDKEYEVLLIYFDNNKEKVVNVVNVDVGIDSEGSGYEDNYQREGISLRRYFVEDGVPDFIIEKVGYETDDPQDDSYFVVNIIKIPENVRKEIEKKVNNEMTEIRKKVENFLFSRE